MIKKIKNIVPWIYVIIDLEGEEIVGTFYEKELKKYIYIYQQEFRIEKVIKKKGDKLYVKWKGYDSSFNSWIDKKDFGGHSSVLIDLPNYATKSNSKNATGIDTSKLAAKSDLVSLKTEADKLDINKLKNVSTNLSNLESKVDKLDTDKLAPVPVKENEVVRKTEYNVKIKNIEDKIPDITNLATKNTLNAKLNKVKDEIPSISSLTTTSALTAVENKVRNVSILVKKKTGYDTKRMQLKRKLLIIVMINTLIL